MKSISTKRLDIEGRELGVGDWVAYTSSYGSRLHTGYIERFTPQKAVMGHGTRFCNPGLKSRHIVLIKKRENNAI